MNTFLTSFALLVIAFNGITAEPVWSDLRVGWGPTQALGFVQIPRTVEDAIYTSQNWTKVSSECENNGTFHGFQHVVRGDYGVGLLFDVNGIVAGLQLLLNKSTLLAPGNNVNYPVLPVYQSQVFDDQEFFVITTYFVEPSTICSTGRNASDLEQGTATHLLIQNGTNPNGPLVRIPFNRTEALAENWSNNMCFMGMGVHSFYGVEQYQENNCTQVFPFFGLYDDDGALLGFGSANPGTAENARFEHPSRQAINLIIGPTAPQCILDTSETIGLTTFHAYFIEDPWTISC